MRHLAQVQQDEHGESAKLRLLAVQKAEYTWAVLTQPTEVQFTPFDETWRDRPNALVLVELSDNYTVQQVEDALPWMLNFIDDYLSTGLSPQTLQEEVDRAEQWRQSLTLRSQELDRRALEMEARRDQIHELEKNLKQDKERLESLTAQFKSDFKSDKKEDAAEGSDEENGANRQTGQPSAEQPSPNQKTDP